MGFNSAFKALMITVGDDVEKSGHGLFEVRDYTGNFCGEAQ